jgi:hypothetical protein
MGCHSKSSEIRVTCKGPNSEVWQKSLLETDSDELTERIRNYKGKECWQKKIRRKNLLKDLFKANLTKKEADNIKVSDIICRYVQPNENETKREIVEFIKEHEWLGKNVNRPTHHFIAEYRGQIVGVQVLATPNAFSHILGKEFINKEKLIARGACISWSPKGLGSRLLMFSVNWMVKNTEFRIFTAYSDEEARELGTIYQACNFTYLGKKYGGRFQFYDPDSPKRGWFSDRVFRKVGQYKKYGVRLGIEWQKEWNTQGKMHWDKVPDELEDLLRIEAKSYEKRCIKRETPKKHKYMYLKGRAKRETKLLKQVFEKHNPKLIGLEAPKRDDYEF